MQLRALACGDSLRIASLAAAFVSFTFFRLLGTVCP